MAHKKETRGRPNKYSEKTRVLSAQVPISHFDRLKTILDYELSKLQIKR